MSIFGKEHILYCVIAFILMISSVVIIAKFVPKNKVCIPIKIVAAITLILIIINRIVVAKSRDGTWLDFLPDTFCSMMGFFLPIVVLCFKPTTKMFHFAIFSGMIGGFLTLMYPDFFVYFDNFWNIHPFTGILYHTGMFYLFLLSICTGYFQPTFRNWIALPLGLSCMVVVGEFGNSVLKQANNMYLNNPLIENTIFSWWFVGILFIGLVTLIIQIYEMVTLPKNKWSIVLLFSNIKNKKRVAKEMSESNQIQSGDND